MTINRFLIAAVLAILLGLLFRPAHAVDLPDGYVVAAQSATIIGAVAPAMIHTGKE